MDFIMFPPKALCNSYAPPFSFSQQSKCSRLVRIEVFLRDHLEKLLRKYDMSIFKMIVSIAIRIMNPSISLMKD